MNNGIRIPGFPPPEKQDSVKFYVLKSLSYSTRMIIYLLFIAFGFIIQYVMMNAWPGAIFLICATVLNLVRGYDSRARLKAFEPDTQWTTVDMGRIYEIENLEKKAKKWDRDVLDISNGLGAFVFILLILGLFILSSVLSGFYEFAEVRSILLTDTIILILPMWFNGIRRILTQNNLRIKIDIIKSVEEYFRTVKLEGEHFKPALMLARDKTGKSMPKDVRFTITFDDMPADFYGIQAQININLVQGTGYPYFYCVIPAKTGFGLREHLNKIPRDKNVIIEFQHDVQAEVIVIRQYTTQTSGYHTKPKSCRYILAVAIHAARMILKDK